MKLGDENYQKTADTARLVEQHYTEQDWTHVLLLPKRKRERLTSIVEPPLKPRTDGLAQLHWEDPGPIDVLYWRDVTSALRLLLRHGTVIDDHWAANAYLFCAVAEQQLMQFQPQAVIDRLAVPTDVVDTIQPIGIAEVLEQQLTYLRERVRP
ncbi:hypothetical protein FCF25_02070 [Haloprofundus sp. MHR1]|nr:hypothetical protein FCF25_02070 [Haloprofundus sp. MHR1]